MQRRSTLRLWLLAGALSGSLSCLLTAPSDDELVGSCEDGKKNGDETDVDCGGACKKCGESRGCKAPADCTSGSCISGGCAAPSCIDKVKNGMETDVDCGGPTAGAECPYCKLGKGCVSENDCDCDTICLVCSKGKCVAPSCTDMQLDGDETDVDCGGPDVKCPRCPVGKSCFDNTDCLAPATCDQTTSFCT